MKTHTSAEPKRDWRARRSTSMMTGKYLFALSLIALLSITNYFLIETRRAANEAGVSVMLAVSREVALVGRIAGLAQYLVLSDERARPDIRQKLTAAIAEAESVRENLRKLSQTAARGPMAKFFDLGVSIPPVEDMKVEQYLNAANDLATSPSEELTSGSASLDAIRNAILTYGLTDTLDRFAFDYQKERMRDVNQLQSLLRWTLLSMIGVLIATSAVVFFPMTRRIRNEVAALEASEAYIRAIVESAKDGIIATDSMGRIELLNPSSARMFGFTTTNALGRDANEILPWSAKNAERSEAAGSTLQGRRIDGSSFPIDLTIAEAQIGRRVIFIGVVRDISERLRLEGEKLQAERLATIGAMSAGLVHEIRNPLGSIKLNLQLLSEKMEEFRRGSINAVEDGEALLRSVSSELERIHRVTDDYLLFARLPHTQLDEVSLNQILLKGLRFVKPMLEQARVQLSVALVSAPPKVRGDAEQLWQAFLNLIRNAVEAMPEGGTLTIRTGHSQGEVEVTITDSGPGIDEEHRARLFQPFFTTKSTGTGLGLALVHQIVREHGGRISCRSSNGDGASFIVALPQSTKHSTEEALE